MFSRNNRGPYIGVGSLYGGITQSKSNLKSSHTPNLHRKAEQTVVVTAPVMKPVSRKRKVNTSKKGNKGLKKRKIVKKVKGTVSKKAKSGNKKKKNLVRKVKDRF